MAKKKRKIPSSRRTQPQKQQIPNPNEQPPTTKITKISISGIVVSLVTLSSLIIFWPRMSVDSGETSDPRNPFMSSFVISNDGYGFCYPVKYSLNMKKMRLKMTSTLPEGEYQALVKISLDFAQMTKQQFLYKKHTPSPQGS